MRGVHRYRREHRHNAPVVKSFRRSRSFGIQFVHRQHTDGLLRQRRKQLLVPAFVLVADKHLHRGGNLCEFLFGGQPIRSGLARTMFDPLQKTRNAHLHELIQIIGRNGQKLHALQQRIIFVARFFQYAPVELQPLQVPVEVVARIVQSDAFHRIIRRNTHSYCRRVTGR